MVRDTLEDVAQVGFGVERVELGGADQDVDRGGLLTAGVLRGDEPLELAA